MKEKWVKTVRWCVCVCVSIFAAPCVSLYTTPIHHSSLSPLGQLITFSCSLTHIKKTSPFQTVWTDFILPRRPLSNIFFFLSPLWTQGSLHCPRSVKLSSALARVRVPGRVKLNSAALQWETLTGLHKTSGSERSLLKLSGNWFECWVHRQNNIDLWRFHIRGKSIFQLSRIKHYISHSPAQCYSRGCLAAAAAGLLAMLSSPETQWIVFTYTCTSHCALLIKMADFFGSEMLSR